MMIATQVIPINPFHPESNRIQIGADFLRQGKPVVFPTETVYGLGANIFSESGIQKIYAIKGREKGKPLPVMIGNLEMLSLLVETIPEEAKVLMRKFWPGPLTLVLPAKTSLSRNLIGINHTVAIRYPDHPVPLALLQALQNPIVATSANLSGHPPPINALQALVQLNQKIPLLLDGGNCIQGKESTIVECTETGTKILRTGCMKKILFVCTGNTCRSPIAEGYFNFLTGKENLDSRFLALSAGVHAFDGSPPASEAQKVCAAAGFDISSHRSRKLTKDLVEEAFLILVMTQDQKKEILSEFPANREKIFTLKECAGKEGDIRDPIGLSSDAYQAVFQEIQEATKEIFQKVKEDENRNRE